MPVKYSLRWMPVYKTTRMKAAPENRDSVSTLRWCSSWKSSEKKKNTTRTVEQLHVWLSLKGMSKQLREGGSGWPQDDVDTMIQQLIVVWERYRKTRIRRKMTSIVPWQRTSNNVCPRCILSYVVKPDRSVFLLNFTCNSTVIFKLWSMLWFLE